MLVQLLEAFLELDLPDADIRFLIVDNDPEAGARPVVESFQTRCGGRRLEYWVEPEAGIPAGRNRALQEAIDGGGDLLCFIDDDALPDRAWLRGMLSCHRETSAAMVFGPIRYKLWIDAAGWWCRFLGRSIVARGRVMEGYAAREAGQGRVIGGSGNCTIDLAWVVRNGIRFDAAMRESGGSDTAFREAVRTRGGRLAWCRRAIVFEQLPPERITLRYQLRRSRAQGMTFEHLGRRAHMPILRHPAGRILAGIGVMIVPVFGVASIALGLHLLGMGLGILQARHGGKSRLYARQ